jgi:5-methylcytosine-specific restriction enzyme subunit McrC
VGDSNNSYIRAQGVAGYFSVGPLTIEVKPKFIKSGESSWRSAFWNILSFTTQRSISGPDAEGTYDFTDSIPDLMGSTFVTGMGRGFRSGLTKGYKEQRETLDVFRGRLDTSKILSAITRPGKVPCVYDDYVIDNPANRLLRWAAVQLADRVVSRRLGRILIRQARQLSALGVKEHLPSRQVAEQIVLPPQYSYLESSLEVARILLRGDSLQHGPGLFDTPSFLWKTDDVFEEFVGVALRQAASNVPGYRLARGGQTLAEGNAGERNIPTEPDFLLEKSDETEYVLDAKYKTWAEHPSTSDVYQVMAGCRVSHCETAVLIYPAPKGQSRSPETWRPLGEGNPEKVKAVYVNLNEMSHRNGLFRISETLRKDIISE